MKSFLTLFLAAVAFPLAAFAQQKTFDFKDPKGVNNVVFKLDAPLESINGTASGISGTVTLDPNNPDQVTGKIVVDTVSLVVPNPVMKDHMHGPDWLHAEAHPHITFEIKEIKNMKKNGNEGTADITGIFTLKGISKEMTVPARVTYLPGRLKDRGGDKDGDLLVVRSNFTINRSDFEIKKGQATDKVAEQIEIALSIAGASPNT
ncbi:MAG: hypothetical protein OHK005_06160 [Candidatus Methylacidiphilales bacterium]